MEDHDERLMIKFRNTILKLQRMAEEVELERMKDRKYLSLDRHELTKILERNGVAVFDVDTDESLREKVKELNEDI